MKLITVLEIQQKLDELNLGYFTKTSYDGDDIFMSDDVMIGARSNNHYLLYVKAPAKLNSISKFKILRVTKLLNDNFGEYTNVAISDKSAGPIAAFAAI